MHSKKIKKSLAIMLVLIVSIPFSSCNRREKQTDEPFSFDEFQSIDLSTSRELITDDSEIIGKPLNLKIINDSIVAVCRMDGEKHVVLYNLNTGKTQTAVKQGTGPLEMINVCGMSIDSDGALLLVGQMDKKIMKTRWNSEADEDALTNLKFQSPVDALRGVADGTGGLILFPAVADSTRLIIIDKEGNVTDSITRFPKAELPPDVKPNNFMFQADISYNPESNKIVIANRSWNEIAIHDLSNGTVKTIKAPVANDIKIEKEAHGDFFSCDPKPFWHLYSGVAGGENSFIVGFVGVQIGSESDHDRYCGKLLEFDWTGKPLKAYLPDKDAMLFDVDYDNGYIYTIENDPDPALYRYKI